MYLHLLSLLQHIPKDKVSTYGNMASFLGVPHNSRQMGCLLRENKKPDIYPCYKVIGANGSLVGYSSIGGVREKEERLDKDGIKVLNGKVQDTEKSLWKPRLHSYFLGIPLEGENKKKFRILNKKIAQIIPEQEAIHFQQSESPHITLHYFGDIALLQVASIVSSLRLWEKKRDGEIFSALFSGVSYFGKGKHKKIGFSPCLKGKENIIHLRNELIDSLHIKETTLFIPHLTFFRIKNAPLFSRYEKQMSDIVSDVMFDIPVSKIRLYCAVEDKRQVPLVDFSL